MVSEKILNLISKRPYSHQDDFVLYHGDSLELLAELPKESIDGALMSTNWRLMSDGVAYRLGILTGRLRGYEREEDLLKLVK